MINYIRILITVLIIFMVSMKVIGQSFIDELTYDEFRLITDKCRMENENKTIPKEIYCKYFKADCSDENIVAIDGYKVLLDSTSVVLIVEIARPMGGATASFEVAVFDDSGMLKDKLIIGGYNYNLDGGLESEISYYNKENLIEVKSISYENYGEDYELRRDKEPQFKYFQYDDNKVDKVSTYYKRQRIYPESSERILSMSELQQYDQMELDIMRNEIFAQYGYKFKSKKWVKYFNDQSWYRINEEYNSSDLTIIENINIKRILSIKERPTVHNSV